MLHEVPMNEFRIVGNLGADLTLENSPNPNICEQETEAYEYKGWYGYYSKVCNSKDASVNRVLLTDSPIAEHIMQCNFALLATGEDILRNVEGYSVIYVYLVVLTNQKFIM
eukprot:UN28243